jgi:hypothetical protein
LGVVGWAGLIWLGLSMFRATPRTAGFDLELVLQAGRDVAAGRSPYAQTMVQGQAPGSTDLFFSYPPPVAQVASLVAGVPSGAMLALLWVASVAGLAWAAVLIARRFAPDRDPASIAVPAVAFAPLFLPYSVGLLFGNLDVLFPLVYGLVLVAAIAPSGDIRARVTGGVALALATIVKIAPGALGGWFIGRLARDSAGEKRRGTLTVIGTAVVVGLGALGISVALGGLDLWRDYLPVAAAASRAQLLDPRNVGPAAQVALALGGDEALVRTLQIPVALGAVVAAVAAGALLRDRLLGLTVAAVSTLVILPITWYHYPVALMPFAIAAAARASVGPTRKPALALIGAAAVVASLSIAWVPALWIAVAMLVAGVAASRSRVEDPALT